MTLSKLNKVNKKKIIDDISETNKALMIISQSLIEWCDYWSGTSWIYRLFHKKPLIRDLIIKNSKLL